MCYCFLNFVKREATDAMPIEGDLTRVKERIDIYIYIRE